MKRRLIASCIILAMVMATVFATASVSAKPPKAPTVTITVGKKYKSKGKYYRTVTMTWTERKGAKYDILAWGGKQNKKWEDYNGTSLTTRFKVKKNSYKVGGKVRAIKNGTGKYSTARYVTIKK